MNRNLNASSVAEALPSMDPSVQWFLMQMLMTGGFGTTLPMNLNPYYLPGSMPQTGANVPSSSVRFPKIYLKTLRIKLLNIIFHFQGTSDDPSLHHGANGLKSLKLIYCFTAINIVSFFKKNRSRAVGRSSGDNKTDSIYLLLFKSSNCYGFLNNCLIIVIIQTFT